MSSLTVKSFHGEDMLACGFKCAHNSRPACNQTSGRLFGWSLVCTENAGNFVDLNHGLIDASLIKKKSAFF